ncbi:MAG: helix-turn-helix transcriptional regulator [Verrucomicrobiia bacterium]|jgi:ribosome-binding protein aMBF1 (putative translation factor)
MRAKQNIVGPQIRKHRYQQELSQEMLVARCATAGLDISRGTLAKIEAGVRCVSDHEVLLLAKALKVNLHELYPAHLSSKTASGRSTR